MGNPENSEKFVKSELQTKATASLQAEVEKDLKQADPEKAVATQLLSKGILGANARKLEKEDNEKDGCGCKSNRCDRGAT